MRDAVLQDYRRTHAALGFAIADLRCELAFRRLLRELKANFNPAQPRAPRGSSIGGQWVDASPTSAPVFREPRRAWASNVNDGVYRPGEASLFLTGGGGSRFRSGGNRLPTEMTMREVFPGFSSAAPGAILAPFDDFLGLSAPGEAANLAVTQLQFQSLYTEMRQLDPAYRPPSKLQSLEEMTWQARAAYIGLVRQDRAAALYNIRGQIEPLQVETLRFLQRRVDVAYARAQANLKAGRLSIRLSSQEALGNYVDMALRAESRALYDGLRIDHRNDPKVRIQKREYDGSGSDLTYRVPDLRIGNLMLDVTTANKTLSSPQIRGFFRADSMPDGVIIIRPTSLGGAYIIKRPAPRVLGR